MASGGWSRRSFLQATAGASIAGRIAGCTTPTTGPSPDTDWPMAGYDRANTGVAPAGAGPVRAPSQAWEVRTPQAITSPPAVAENVVYFSSLDSSIRAVSAESGIEQSVTQMRTPAFGTPAVADETVYIGTSAGNLWAFETAKSAETGVGAFRWRADARGGLTGGPTVIDGTVYAGTGNGHLHAYNATSGREEWVTTIGGSGAITPAVKDELVFVPTSQGAVLAFEAKTGRLAWETSLPGEISAGVTVRAGRLYVGIQTTRAYDNAVNVYALDTRDGREHWRAGIAGSANGIATVTAETVLMATWNGTVHALDTATGDEQWLVEFDRDPTGPPAVAGEIAYISVFDSQIYAVDVESGQHVWNLQMDGIPGPPVVASGGLFAATDESTIYRFGS